MPAERRLQRGYEGIIKMEKILDYEHALTQGFIDIGNELIRIEKQLDVIGQKLTRCNEPKHAYLFLKYSYEAQLCDTYHLLHHELQKRGIIGYTPGVQQEQPDVLTFGAIGEQILQAIGQWRQLIQQLVSGALLPKQYCLQRFTYEMRLFCSRNQLIQALWKRGLLTVVQKRTPCFVCGSKQLCKHKSLNGWPLSIEKDKGGVS